MLKVGDAVFFRPNRDYHTDVTDRCIMMGAVSRTQDIPAAIRCPWSI